MKYAVALAGLLTLALADDCSKACADAHDACLTKPDTNRAACAAEYAGCLGYNPYDVSPWVEPTACSKTTAVSPTATATATATGAPDACAKACIDKRDACNSAPGANHATCAAEFAACVGYNPYASEPYVEPTACHKGSVTGTVAPTTTSMAAPTGTGKPDACAKACIDKRDACNAAPGANHSTCAAEFAACVGYNPYASEPYVEPTACHKGSATGTVAPTAPTTKAPAPIVTAAGDRVQPALAMLALGAAALL